MFNMMKADLRRILRGKGIWITLVIFLGMIVMNTMVLYANIEGQQMGGISIQVGEMQDNSLDDIEIVGGNVPQLMMGNAETVLVFSLPFVLFIAATDFGSGTVKNVLSSGASRLKYYTSKLLLCWVFALLLYLAHLSIPTIVITLANGFGDNFAYGTLGAFLGQILFVLAITALGVFLTFTSKKSAAVIGGYLALLFLPPIVVSLLMQIDRRLLNLMHYDLVHNFIGFANYTALPTSYIIRAIIIGFSVLIASTIGGMALFRKAEIK